MLFTRVLPLKGLLRAVVIIPLGVPTIVSASNMSYIFDTQGYLNELLRTFHIINTSIEWTGGGIVSLIAISLSDMWKVTPVVMLILLAGMEQIPLEVFEASRVDGASFWQTFRYITLPLLKPFITIAIIVRGIDAFRMFELPLILVGNTVPVLSTYSYFEYFQYNNACTAAACAVILFLLILLCAVMYIKAVGRQKTIYNL